MALTQVDQGLLGQYAQYTGFKNRIINGAMVIDQRNAGAAQTGLSGSGYFFCDRFRSGGGTWSTMRFTLQQVTDAPSDFVKSAKITITTAQSAGASDLLTCTHIIEGYNIADLGWGTSAAKTITISFWIKSSATGTFGLVVSNDSNRYYATTYTISSANTWEQKTITIPGDTSGTWSTTNTAGIRLDFGLGIGSSSSGATANTWGSSFAFTSSSSSITGTLNATWQITGVQLEKGSTATSFDYRPYGTELALAQRYYWTSYPSGTAVGSASAVYPMTMTTANATSIYASSSYTIPVNMRSAPTGSVYSNVTGTVLRVRYVGSATDIAATIIGTGPNAFQMSVNNVSVVGQSDLTYHVTLSAEL